MRGCSGISLVEAVLRSVSRGLQSYSVDCDEKVLRTDIRIVVEGPRNDHCWNGPYVFAEARAAVISGEVRADVVSGSLISLRHVGPDLVFDTADDAILDMETGNLTGVTGPVWRVSPDLVLMLAVTVIVLLAAGISRFWKR